MMPRNAVQFQKGLSEAKFAELYGSEEKCRAALFAWRWPEGFECPACGGARHCVVTQEGRQLHQCNACRVQTSVIAGTIFASTKLPLTTWFRAMYHMTQTKQGISRLELGRRLGVSYNTAWKVHHKLAQVMLEREEAKPLTGRVEADDAYLGGEHGGGKRGRGAPGKMPIVAAVETTKDGKPVRIKTRRVKAFSKKHIKNLAKRIVAAGTTVVTDGLRCFRGFAAAGCEHVAIITGSGRKAARHAAFKCVNTALGNFKSALTGTFRNVSFAHSARSLAEFDYRYNRRYDLAAMIPRLGWAAVRTPPMPYRLLKLAEDCG
jgi:ISXO2-like transposase domain/Transposase zinc-ribbon domain